MNQATITAFLKGESTVAQDEVNQLFQEIQTVYIQHQKNKEIVIDYLKNKYFFEHSFCELLLNCATLYMN